MGKYSEVPNRRLIHRRACSLRFFRFSFHPVRNFSCNKQKILLWVGISWLFVVVRTEKSLKMIELVRFGHVITWLLTQINQLLSDVKHATNFADQRKVKYESAKCKVSAFSINESSTQIFCENWDFVIALHGWLSPTCFAQQFHFTRSGRTVPIYRISSVNLRHISSLLDKVNVQL